VDLRSAPDLAQPAGVEDAVLEVHEGGTPETIGNGSSAYRQEAPVERHRPTSGRTGLVQRGQMKRSWSTIASRESIDSG